LLEAPAAGFFAEAGRALSAFIAWLIELCCRQFLFWTSVAVFSHSAEHGICFSRWRSVWMACASAGDDRVVGVGF